MESTGAMKLRKKEAQKEGEELSSEGEEVIPETLRGIRNAT